MDGISYTIMASSHHNNNGNEDNQNLRSTRYVPDILLSTSYVLTHLIFAITLWCRHTIIIPVLLVKKIKRADNSKHKLKLS